jgi:hypothetical protein
MVATPPNLMRLVCCTYLSFDLSILATLTYNVSVVLVLFVVKRAEWKPQGNIACPSTRTLHSEDLIPTYS